MNRVWDLPKNPLKLNFKIPTTLDLESSIQKGTPQHALKRIKALWDLGFKTPRTLVLESMIKTSLRFGGPILDLRLNFYALSRFAGLILD